MIRVPIEQLAAGLENARILAAEHFLGVHDAQRRMLLSERPDVAFRSAEALFGFGAGQIQKVFCASAFTRYTERRRQIVLEVRNILHDANRAILRSCFAQGFPQCSFEIRVIGRIVCAWRRNNIGIHIDPVRVQYQQARIQLPDCLNSRIVESAAVLAV